jgi:replicative DNA helicase
MHFDVVQHEIEPRSSYDAPNTNRALHAADILERVLDEAARIQFEREAGRQMQGLPTGIPSLDRLLNGLSARSLYILGGAPGAGKTSLALQIASEVAQRAPVLYLSYENSPESLVLKAICRPAGVQPSAVERGRADMQRLVDGAAAFRTISKRIAFLEGTSSLTLDTLRAEAERIRTQHGATLCLIVVDYLQRMAVHQQPFGTVADNVSALSLGMRELASRLQSPILAISSLSRSGSYDMPTLQGLQGSEDLEFAADVVLLLGIRQEVSLSSKALAKASVGSRLLDLTVAKNRYGEAGRRISLLFRPSIGDFEEDTRA